MSPDQQPDYVEVLKRRLPAELFRPVQSRLWWLLVYLPIVTGCTIVIVDADASLLLSLALALPIGLAFVGMGILAHEILHGSVIESRWLRRLLGTMCLAPLNIGVTFWMIWHSTHHGHTQDPRRDPDMWGTVDAVPADKTMRLLKRFIRARSLVFPLLLSVGMTAHATVLLLTQQQRQMRWQQRLLMLTEFLVSLAFWIFLGFWLGWVHWLFFYLIPLLMANLIINSFVVTNHFLNPLDERGDPLASSLTVTLPSWLDKLVLNFNYHTEHHLLPGMNPKYAPHVRGIIQELWPERYHHMSYGRALLAVWKTPRVYYDRVHLIDLHSGTLYPTLRNERRQQK